MAARVPPSNSAFSEDSIHVPATVRAHLAIRRRTLIAVRRAGRDAARVEIFLCAIAGMDVKPVVGRAPAANLIARLVGGKPGRRDDETAKPLARESAALAGQRAMAFVSDEETGGASGMRYVLANVPAARGDAMIAADAGSPRMVRFGSPATVTRATTASTLPVYPGVNG